MKGMMVVDDKVEIRVEVLVTDSEMVVDAAIGVIVSVFVLVAIEVCASLAWRSPLWRRALLTWVTVPRGAMIVRVFNAVDATTFVETTCTRLRHVTDPWYCGGS